MKASELIEQILNEIGLDACDIIEKIKFYNCDTIIKVSTPSAYYQSIKCDIYGIKFNKCELLGLENYITILTKRE